MSALPAPPGADCVINTTLEPCHRCALILYAYRERISWTVNAPAQAFADNDPGAYDLPDPLHELIVQQLVDDGCSAEELQDYGFEVRSLITNFHSSRRRR